MKNKSKEIVRYLINGVAATVLHFCVLYICIEIVNFGSAGFSNLIASILGITCTFLGNRYFVFHRYDQSFFDQAIKFAGLYISIALLNGSILLLWTDILGHEYKIGFLIVLGLQAIIGYFSAKKYVFCKNIQSVTNNIPEYKVVSASSFSYSGNELGNFSSAINWKAYWSNECIPFLGDEVLELGAGIGATIMALNHKQYRKWVAVEPDKAMCSVLEKINANGEFGSGFKVINGTSATLSADNTFDTILYIDVLEHIEDDFDELEHIQNYLVEGGHIIIVAPAHNFLYTAFDKKIGHYRRYNKPMLRSLLPVNMMIKQIRYLDSVGLLASLANKLFLKTDDPTYKQIQVWDRFIVRMSRWIDVMIRHIAGKSIVCVLEKKTTIKGSGS